jgi:hypothetical protein
MHKTGTSSIQEALSSFNDNGILYGDLLESNHSLAFYTLFSKNYLNYHVWLKRGFNIKEIKEKRKVYLTRIANQLTDLSVKKIIFSAESIGLLEEDEKTSMLLFFTQYGVRINVICYVREPVSFAYSVFQEDIRGGFTNIKEIYNPRYKYRLDVFKENPLVNELIVRDYSSLVKKDVVSDLFETLNLNSEAHNYNRENTRLSISAMKLIYLVNKHIREYKCNQKLYDTRLYFNNVINKLYNKDHRLFSDHFKLNIDNSDINYLCKNFHINYNYCSNDDSNTCSTILQWLEDLSDLDPVNLINFANEKGIKYSKQEIDILALDIFNHYLLHL